MRTIRRERKREREKKEESGEVVKDTTGAFVARG
jgi:hypothetical protein